MSLTKEEIEFLEKIIEREEDDSNGAVILLTPIQEGILDLEKRGYCRISNGLVMGVPSGEKVIAVTEAGRMSLTAVLV